MRKKSAKAKPVDLAVEARREKIRQRIEKELGASLGFGLVPIARAVKKLADEAKTDPAKAAVILSSDFRGAVKQLTDFAVPQTQKIEGTLKVKENGHSPEDLDRLRRAAEAAGMGRPAAPEADDWEAGLAPE